MLTHRQKRELARIHADTSNKVREWMSERIEASSLGNVFAEEALRAFLKAYKRFGSGAAALRYLQGGDHEQLTLERLDG